MGQRRTTAATAMAKSRVGGITDDLNLIMKGRSSSELLYYYENRHVACSPIFDVPSNIPKRICRGSACYPYLTPSVVGTYIDLKHSPQAIARPRAWIAREMYT